MHGAFQCRLKIEILLILLIFKAVHVRSTWEFSIFSVSIVIPLDHAFLFTPYWITIIATDALKIKFVYFSIAKFITTLVGPVDLRYRCSLLVNLKILRIVGNVVPQINGNSHQSNTSKTTYLRYSKAVKDKFNIWTRKKSHIMGNSICTGGDDN